MPGTSVLSPTLRPSSVKTTVLTASTEAAVSLISSRSGRIARFNGMVSDSPAQELPSPARKPGSAASSTSNLSYDQWSRPSSA